MHVGAVRRAAAGRPLARLHPQRGRTVGPAVCGVVLLMVAPGWWRLTARGGQLLTAPAALFFSGLLVIGTLSVACASRAISTTRHQSCDIYDPREIDDQSSRAGRLMHDMVELLLDSVAVVTMTVATVLVLVALTGLGVLLLIFG